MNTYPFLQAVIAECDYSFIAKISRIAEIRTAYDDYSENSGYWPGPGEHSAGTVRMPHDSENPADLNGPVIIVQPAKK